MEDKKELLKVLELGRSILLGYDKKTLSYFNNGDLIYDSKNDEYGIYIGEKPITFSGDDGLHYFTQQARDLESISSTLALLLTLTKKESEGKDKKDVFDWRVRYTPFNSLRKIQDIKAFLKDKDDKDLKIFCEQQCIQECSEECVLRKYRKNL